MKLLHRLFVLVLIGALLMGCLPAVSAAESGKTGEVTWTFKDGVLTFSGKGATEDLDAHAVGDWYVHWEDIRTVVFQEGVTRIGDYLFYDDTIYNSIQTIRFPSTLEEIGEHAFTTLKKLNRVVIPDLAAWCNVKMKNGSNPLDNQADLYLKDKRVTHLEIPASVAVIGNFAFKGCRSITKVTIHGNVKRIGDYAFNSCANLKELYFEGGAPSLGQHILTLTKVTVYTPKGNSSWTDTVKTRLDKKNTATWKTYAPTTTAKPTTTTTTAKPTTTTTAKPTTTTTEKTTEKTTASTTKVTSTTETTSSSTTTAPTAVGEAETQAPSTPNNGWWIWVAVTGGVILAALLGWLLAKWLAKR